MSHSLLLPVDPPIVLYAAIVHEIDNLGDYWRDEINKWEVGGRVNGEDIC